MFEFLIVVGIILVIVRLSDNKSKISDIDLTTALRKRMDLATNDQDRKKIADVIDLYSLNKIDFRMPDQMSSSTHPGDPVAYEDNPYESVTGIRMNNFEPIAPQSVPQSVPQSAPPSVPIGKSIKDSLENINILLYLGSFLIVVSAGIFVGFNYQLLSGSSKTFFILIFSLIFYLSGLGLYCFTSKLKPAGLTFNTIGMVIFPLVGVAYWRFVAMGEYSHEVWFATSLITLLFYIASVLIIKKTFIAYFLTFTALSLFESSISMFDFPMYYLLWGMAIFSLIVNFISRKINPGYGVKESLEYTSQFVLPFSIFCSILTIGWLGMMQAGVNALIASAFYMTYSLLEEKKENKELAFAGSVAFLYLGTSLLAYNAKNNLEIVGVVLILISAAASALSIVMTKLFTRNIQAVILAVYSAFGSLLAGAFVYENHNLFFLVAIAALTINLANMLAQKNIISLGFAIVSLMQIPAIYFGLMSDKASDNYMLVASYILIGVLFQVLKTGLVNLGKEYKDLLLAGTYSSLIIALFIALTGGIQSVIFGALMFVGLFFLLLSFYEYMTTYCVIGFGFILLAAFSFRSLIDMDASYLALLLTGMGLGIYTLHSMFNDDRKIVFQAMSVIYAMISTIYAFYSYGIDVVPIIVFYTFGALIYYMGYEREEKYVRYAGSAILIGATETLMNYFHIKELHYYMLPWSVYFGTLGYLQHKEGRFENRDLLVGIALCFQTLTLFAQTQGDNKQMYGLILGFESIFIIITGMIIKYNLLKYWGSAALMIIVLFQLKDELMALPKWLIIGVIGLAFLFGASYMLYKKQEDGQ